VGGDNAVANHVDSREGVLNGGDELARQVMFRGSVSYIDLYRNDAVHVVQKHGRIGRHSHSPCAEGILHQDICIELAQETMKGSYYR
jgi:hypothetical protein